MHHGTCLNCHCEAPKGPWRPEREARGSALGVQSREGSYVFAGIALLSCRVLRDSHVASLLGMTRQVVLWYISSLSQFNYPVQGAP